MVVGRRVAQQAAQPVILVADDPQGPRQTLRPERLQDLAQELPRALVRGRAKDLRRGTGLHHHAGVHEHDRIGDLTREPDSRG